MTSDLTSLLSTAEGRKALSHASPQFFDSYYLGMTNVHFRNKWLDTIDELEKEAQETNLKKKLLVLAPRNHGKSFLAISYCLRKICLNRNIRILFISASANQAEKRVRLIKQSLTSKKIIEDFGEFKGDDTKWSSTQIYVKRDEKSVDPTLEAVGSGGKITGAHVDIVVLDDVEDDITVSSPSIRAKTRDWLRGTITPILNNGGLMLVIGTRKHYDDLYAHMMNDATFEVINDPAIIKWPTTYEYVTEIDDKGREKIKSIDASDDYEVLWPEQRPLPMLLMEKRSIGNLLFEREFQNKVISGDEAIIKDEWLEMAKDTSYSLGEVPHMLDLEECTVIQAWDLALEVDKKAAARNDSDWTVGWTIARDDKGCHWVLDFWRNRGISSGEVIDGIISQYEKWSEWVNTVVVEKNSFGALYVEALKNTDLPIRAYNMHKRNALKIKIHKIAIQFENENFKFPVKNEKSKNTYDIFVEEAMGYPYSSHDDTLTSLKWAIEEFEKNSDNYSLAINNKIINNKGEVIQSDNDATQEDLIDDVLQSIGVTREADSDEKRMLERFGFGED